MPNPTITPYATPTTAYQVSDSDTAYYDISLSNLGDSAEFLIQVPNGAEVTIWALGVPGDPWAPAPADTRTLFNGSTWTGATLAGWSLVVSPGAPAVISVNQGAGPSSGSVRIRVTNIRNASPTATCTLTAQFNADTVRILADPRISGTPAPTGITLFEGTDFTLTATVSVSEEHGVVPVVFGALPAVTGVWEVDPNNLAIEEPTGLNPVFHAPGVYEDTDVGFTLQAFYDFDGSGTFSAGEPDNDAHVLLTIQRAHHRMILVLDRSGSMSAKLQPTDEITRWDAALRASHIWADVFLAMRGGEGQQVGILTFEHGGCSWSTAAGSSEIRLRNPSNGANASNLESTGAYTNRTNLNLGSPQSCTPLGDAVVKAAQALVGTATGINTTSPQASDYLSLVVLTDGYENSGLVTVRNAPPNGQPGVSTLASRLNQPEFDALDSNRFKLYTIGVGSSVDEDALDSLPSIVEPSSPSNGYYRLTQDLADFSDVLGQMLGDTIDAEQVGVNLAGNEATFPLNSDERRLVVVVPWGMLGDTIELSQRPQDSDEPWVPISPGAGTGATLFQRVHHGMIVVDLEQAFNGPAPAREWRVRHLSGGDAQSLTNVLAYVDLHVKAFLSVDKTSYRTGEPIQLRCALRAGSKPIKNATIRAEVLAPGEGLGTFLATHGATLGPIPVTQLATLSHPGALQP
ncbi:MAG TPA: vWA domain-containing protein, partial [Polyangiaceae bacterium]